jgi:hypothetical protein
MRDYALPRDYILFDLPMVQGFAYCAAAIELHMRSDPWSTLERDSDAYIAQHWQQKL